jgi:hypothetical protein
MAVVLPAPVPVFPLKAVVLPLAPTDPDALRFVLVDPDTVLAVEPVPTEPEVLPVPLVPHEPEVLPADPVVPAEP